MKYKKKKKKDSSNVYVCGIKFKLHISTFQLP